MSLQLVYTAPEKVDTREDWQKTGRYRYCMPVINEDGTFAVMYCLWGTEKNLFVEGFKSQAAALLHAKGMNIKEVKQ